MGSGKSTFPIDDLPVPAQSSQIPVDVDEPTGHTTVTLTNHQQYRNLFTTIFTDFHF